MNMDENELKSFFMKEGLNYGLKAVEVTFNQYIKPLVKSGLKKRQRTTALEEGLKQYVQRCYAHASMMNVISFTGRTRKMEDLYVEQTLVSQSGEEFIVDDAYSPFEMSSRVMIVDAAGMGKTTLVKKVMLNSIRKAKTISFLYNLRSFSTGDSIIRSNMILIGEFSLKKITSLEGLKVEFYLDGLDEVDDEVLVEVIDQINKIQDEIPDARLLVTSRKQKEIENFIDFPILNIKEMTQKEAFELIAKYDGFGDTSKSLIGAIKMEGANKITDFLSNPLYVSLLYCAYRHHPSLPTSMHIFYEQVFSALFDRHDLSKEANYQHPVRSGLNITQFCDVLKRIAMSCLIKGFKVEFSRVEFEKTIDEAIKCCSGIEHVDSSFFMRDITVAVPLFVEEGDSYRWTHKALLEYFAAQFIVQNTGNKAENFLYKFVQGDNPWKYLHILEIVSELDYECFRNSVGKDVLENFLSYVNLDKAKVENYGRLFTLYGCSLRVIVLNIEQIQLGAPVTNSDEILGTSRVAKRTMKDVLHLMEKLMGEIKKEKQDKLERFRVISRKNESSYKINCVIAGDGVYLIDFSSCIERDILTMIAKKEKSAEHQPEEEAVFQLGDFEMLNEKDYPLTESKFDESKVAAQKHAAAYILEGNRKILTKNDVESILMKIEHSNSEEALERMLEGL